MKHRNIRAFSRKSTGIVASALMLTAGLITTSARDAQAAFARYHASSCNVQFGTPHYAWGSSGQEGNGGAPFIYNDIVILACPIPDTSEFRKWDIERITLFYQDGTGAGNNYTVAAACGVDRNSISAACGYGQTNGGSGFKQAVLGDDSLELDIMQSSQRDDWFFELQVYVRSDSSFNPDSQTLYGYTVHDS